MHVRLENAEGATAFLMRVTTVLEDATVFIILSKERDDAWPYKLVNQTNEDITFYQAVRGREKQILECLFGSTVFLGPRCTSR